MKALKIIGIVLLSIIVILLVVVLIQPSQGHIEKSVVINAPASAVYAEVSSFKNFNAWSPWAKMDPQATYSIGEVPSGMGAKMSWDGKTIGKGSQWIEEAVENQRVKCGLAFEGFEGKAYAEFVLSPEGEGTKVTWTYDGDNVGMGGKAMWMMMKGALATQYEQGLNDLKQVIESKPAQPESETTPADSTQQQ